MQLYVFSCFSVVVHKLWRTSLAFACSGEFNDWPNFISTGIIVEEKINTTQCWIRKKKSFLTSLVALFSVCSWDLIFIFVKIIFSWEFRKTFWMSNFVFELLKPKIACRNFSRWMIVSENTFSRPLGKFWKFHFTFHFRRGNFLANGKTTMYADVSPVLDKVENWDKSYCGFIVQEQTHQEFDCVQKKSLMSELLSCVCCFCAAVHKLKNPDLKKRQRIFILHTCESLAFFPSLSRFFSPSLDDCTATCDCTIFNSNKKVKSGKLSPRP